MSPQACVPYPSRSEGEFLEIIGSKSGVLCPQCVSSSPLSPNTHSEPSIRYFNADFIS